MASPELSVIITCFNDGPFIKGAVASVLEECDREGAPSSEVFLVDDRSEDPETREALEEIAGWGAGIRILTNRGAHGSGASKNRALEVARGEWVGFLDGDDFWTPGSLSDRWAVVAAEPEAQWVGADLGRIDENGQTWLSGIPGRPSVLAGERNGPHGGVRVPRPVRGMLWEGLCHVNVTLIRRQLLAGVGNFDERLYRWQDYNLWVRLAARTDYWVVPSVAAYHRHNPQSVTNRHAWQTAGYWARRALRLAARDPALSPHKPLLRERISWHYRDQAYDHRRYGERARAAWTGALALFYGPGIPANWRALGGAVLRSSREEGLGA